MTESLNPMPDAAVAKLPEPIAAGRIGVLLVNLGTPDGPDPGSVRRYLREFLSDPRVIENQGLIWKLVLNGVILPIRPRRKARDYAKIWNRELNESPLKTITRQQADKLAAMLKPLAKSVMVDWAMRYGNPAIAERIGALAAKGCERILVIPLYPQYCAATTATVGDAVFKVLARMRRQPAVRIAAPYFDDQAYIGALASSSAAEIKQLAFEPDVIVASFHGIPKAFVAAGDPYYDQCLETMRLLRRQMGLDENKLILTFQSRFGLAEWLGPATDQTMKDLGGRGVKKVVVITPGFSADCLETLEEIGMENAEIFRHAGGESFAAIPCLNDSDLGMNVIRRLTLRELAGWI
jgi:ferrochelatase